MILLRARLRRDKELRLAGVLFARSSLEFSVNLAKWLAKLRRRKARWNPRHGEVERINHRRR